MARDPTTPDEELLEAETRAIVSLLDDGARVDRVAEELRLGFGTLAHVGKAVSVFGSARTPESDAMYEAARDLSRRLGEEGFAVVTGGGPGIMEAANRGAHEAGVPSIGLGIDLPQEQALNDWIDVPLEFHYFFTRKLMFVRYASAFVVFPGGFGTLDELFEAATLRQTEKIRWFPVILFGTEYWSGLIKWLRDPVQGEGKISADDVDLIEVTDDPGRVLELVRGAEHRRPRAAP
ncbi:MAG: LOG family protein [Candidatus Limnocylindria bacterium]